MAQVPVNFRMDEELKSNFENVCAELGMNVTTAITVFAKQVTRERAIPFQITLDPFYSKTNIKALKKSEEQIQNGKVVTKTMEELERMANE